MKITLLTAAAVAVALSTAGEADAATMERRGWGALYTQKYYGATGCPWQSWSKPGWYVGKVPDTQGAPKWDGGKTIICKTWPWSWTSFCKSGNPTKPVPPPRWNNWGLPGKLNWPHPWYNGGGGIKKPVSTTKVVTSTVTKVVPTTTVTTVTNSGTTTAVPTSTDATITSTVTNTQTTTTTVSSASTVPTGPPQDTCTDGYQLTFSNYTTIADSGVYHGQIVGAAIVDNANYLTYGLSDTPEGCLDVCDGVDGCAFVNSYIDHGDMTDGDDVGGKYSGSYTCALYAICESTSAATNWGGQNDPSYITDSAGWCKSAACN